MHIECAGCIYDRVLRRVPTSSRILSCRNRSTLQVSRSERGVWKPGSAFTFRNVGSSLVSVPALGVRYPVRIEQKINSLKMTI